MLLVIVLVRICRLDWGMVVWGWGGIWRVEVVWIVMGLVVMYEVF